MVRRCRLGPPVLLLVATACSGSATAPPTAEGVLVLEVGGDASSLREALRALGEASEPAPAPDPTSAPREVHAPGEEPRPNAEPADGPPPRNQPAAAPPAADAAWFTVALAEGQTPIHLARKHLGDGNRFREILQLNGWSESDARRLHTGQVVKIPRTPRANSPGRR